MRLRAAAPDAVPGPATVLRLLGSARPADVPHVLGTLTPDQLAEAVATVDLPLAPAVVAHVSRCGPPQARRVLARRLVQQPEHVPPRPLTLDAYLIALAEAAATDYRDDAVTRLRALALAALCAGALTAEQILDHTRPAALTLALAVCTPADYARPWMRRATGDVRVLLARRLSEELGEDDRRWAAAITVSGSFTGTVAELLHSDQAPAGFRRFFDANHSDYAPQNVLLALAPRGVAGRYLAGVGLSGPAGDHQWEWMLASGPLSRPLVDHVLAHGTVGHRRRLLGNELCPDYVLEQAPVGYTREILLRRLLPPHVRSRAFHFFDREPREARLWARGLAERGRDDLIDLAWSLLDAPELLRQVVVAALGRADQATLTCLYGALAEAAGPEPVWALDLERAGSLEAVLPPVRASMASCSAEPLVEAARQTPRRHWIDVLDPERFGCQGLRAEAELDRTGHFPLEALVAAHLDGRADFWAELARRLAAGATPVESAITDVAARTAVSASTT
ncbi:hypothetical protein [Catenulispora rubra]|uniref:hypothetical protein n=1 Tax=Catenulispora rubra TaxID=280293 RepID=UPI001892333C|nr:hypothetical protein [Catenulispora rubra]